MFARALLGLAAALPQPLAARDLSPPPPIIAGAARILPVQGARAMAVAQEKAAAAIGADIMRRGGNAVDAAVAIGFALAVTLPRAGNLGGGGFMTLYAAREKRAFALDFRERAPAAARSDMFLNAQGQPDPALSRESALAIAVPGTVAGLVYAHAKWGSGAFTLAQLIAPAIVLAREGLIVADDLADSLQAAAPRLGRFASSRAIFFNHEGAPLKSGEKLVQSELAETLERIAQSGAAGFYQGMTAERLCAAVLKAGGRLTPEDLRDYRAVERDPLLGSYRGRTILTMPPPSSGGVHLVQLLNVLENFPLDKMGAGSAQTIHVMAEAMKYSFVDRAAWLGDPDFAKAPIAGLTSKKYAREIADRIALDRARPADEISPLDPAPFESDQTTHYSVTDAEGNAVAVTTTLNFSYGVGMVAEGVGFLLNNEMDDFAAKAGARDAFGLVGGPQNLPEAGKRPLSSMTPTIVLKDDAVEIVTGSPGGPRIITTVLETLVDLIDFDMNPAEAMIAPRFHHQWRPDELRLERGFSPDTIALLRARGQNVVEREAMGSIATIQRKDGVWLGASDTRQRGTGAVGF